MSNVDDIGSRKICHRLPKWAVTELTKEATALESLIASHTINNKNMPASNSIQNSPLSMW